MLDAIALMIGYGVLGVVVVPFAAFAGLVAVVAIAALLAALWELLLAALGRMTKEPRDG